MDSCEHTWNASCEGLGLVHFPLDHLEVRPIVE